MATQPAPEAGGTGKAGLPLFYRDPQPLSSSAHADWRLKSGDASFAAEAAYVPIVAAELTAAARCYPVVFAAGDAQLVAVLGLQRRNLFVKDGQWSLDCYVPAYVRRYPFGFIATGKPDEFVLAVDAASERIERSGGEGTPLFEDGKPAELTRQALAFCDAFQSDARATRAFAEALKAEDLLIDRRVDATLPDGRKLGLEGFQIVDRERFARLPDEAVKEWHGNGYLAWVHFHLASLDRFSSLLDRQARADASEAAPEPVHEPKPKKVPA
ncbi:SapC family protein [Pelagerythrobacter rhizovicinus]|uniref:Peptidase n=1 Tax=Pelagerythrobacter rhizovicinus TaxID=2268576 RepID=A0A4Q2KPK7_9SPHN|nr:SapC family protein [Pelagerythrobacter rhizovicinus]RXZ66310.1 peptidase [Pelagerythrobacter rhizovicinus]